jgi:hypothetical protein
MGDYSGDLQWLNAMVRVRRLGLGLGLPFPVLRFSVLHQSFSHLRMAHCSLLAPHAAYCCALSSSLLLLLSAAREAGHLIG